MTLRRAAVACALLGIAVLAACLLVVTTRSQVVAGSAAAPSAVGVLPAPAAEPADRPVAPPSPDGRVRLARLGLDAAIVPVRLHGRVMQVPRDPSRVGWWRGGAVPGAAHGSAVLVGHVNYAGTSGALAVLPRTRPGDRVVLTSPRLQFRVVAVRTYPKTAGIPAAAFAGDGPGQLVLITCGGDFDARSGNYVDNVVVYAVRV